VKPSTSADAKESVRAYWDAAPCGSSHATAEPGSKEFFDQVEEARYRLEPFIPRFAQFERWRGKQVLEVGVGLGTDLIRFGRAGAYLSGIDLTEASIELVRRRLALEGLNADLRAADAEDLPFDDDSFDLVYSWGVLHHTPDTARAVREAVRVARPGGKVCVMMYGRHSWVSYGLWVRHALVTGHPWRSLRDVLAHHIESEGTKAFTSQELRQMFAGVDALRIDRVATPYDRRVAGPLARVTGGLLGWFIVVRGRIADSLPSPI
jgi:ubiquinone/menaquinone biosynthesis C-methylase UbiE